MKKKKSKKCLWKNYERNKRTIIFEKTHSVKLKIFRFRTFRFILFAFFFFLQKSPIKIVPKKTGGEPSSYEHTRFSFRIYEINYEKYLSTVDVTFTT